ncbi:hypothetical protein WJX74_002255 [Apatococcus lobatus]|uniref:Transmembrane protein n=1 Tax=Apatococcus lobatus TaxID=904363 RepID=A0AAW1RDS8_9CHLO
MAILPGAVLLFFGLDLTVSSWQARQQSFLMDWLPVTLGGSGFAFIIVGGVGAVGAWGSLITPTAFYAGANTVLLIFESLISCAWFFKRDVLDDAAAEDDSKRLQGLLDWADNHVIVFYCLAGIFLGFQVLGVIIALLYSGCVSLPGKGQPSSSSSVPNSTMDPEAMRAGGITLLPPNNSTLVFSAAPANGAGATVFAQPGEGDSAHSPLLQDVEQGNGSNRNSGRHS